MVQCMRAFTETDFRGEMAAIKVPSLILYGTGDPPLIANNAARTRGDCRQLGIDAYEALPTVSSSPCASASMPICSGSLLGHRFWSRIYRVGRGRRQKPVLRRRSWKASCNTVRPLVPDLLGRRAIALAGFR